MPFKLQDMSLKTRVLLLVLILMIAGIWGLAARTAAVLQADIEKLLADQMSAAVGYIAADLDDKIQLRIDTLKEVAASVTPEVFADPVKFRRLLDQRSVSATLFPTGLFAAGRDGIMIADHPPLARRVGSSIADFDYFRTVLSSERVGVGSPLMGRFSGRLTLPLAVPLHDAAGLVNGALVGAVFPSDNNLFGRLEEARIGQHGSYLVAAPADKVFVAATEKNRVMQPFPAKGVNPVFDRRIEEGFDGPGVTVNSLGIETLSISHRMKTTGWIVIGSVPTEEAFAPIATLKRQIYMSALLMTVIMFAVLSYVLARQLAPLEDAGAHMRRMTEGIEPLAALPVVRADEIGQMVSNFNRLVGERQRIEAASLQATGALRESESRLRGLIDGAPFGAFEYELKAGDRLEFCAYNKAAEQILGVPCAGFMGMAIEEAFPALTATELPAAYRRVARTGERYENSDFQYADGAIGGAYELYGFQTAANRMAILFRDVTELRRHQQAAQEQDARYRALVEALAEGVVFQDLNDKVITCNEAALRILGLTRAQMLGTDSMHPRWRMLNPDGTPFATDQAPSVRARTTGQPQREIPIGIHRPDDTIAWLSVNSVPLFKDGETGAYATVTSFSDVSRRVAAEDRLQRLNDELELRVRNRTADLTQAMDALRHAQDDLVRAEKLAALGSLVAGIAHELNTPIGNAVTIASTLRDKSTDFESTVAAGTLRRSVLEDYTSTIAQGSELVLRNLSQAADLVANFKQVAVDQTTAQRRPFDLKEVIEEVLSTLHHLVRKKPIEVVTRLAPDIDMDSFPGPLGQVITNLFNNALIHGFADRNGGEIVIETRREGADRVILEVHDNGNGIPAENLGRVFDPFFTTRLGQGGSGLGLNIVHNIVTRLLGGRIEALSPVSGGTLFRLDLPRVVAAQNDDKKS